VYLPKKQENMLVGFEAGLERGRGEVAFAMLLNTGLARSSGGVLEGTVLLGREGGRG